jgi:hypothetical protein
MVELRPSLMARFAFTSCRQLLAVRTRQCGTPQWQRIRFSLRFSNREKSKGK